MKDTLNSDINCEYDEKGTVTKVFDNETQEQIELFIKISGSIKRKRELKGKLKCFIFFDVVFALTFVAIVIFCTFTKTGTKFIIPVFIIVFAMLLVSAAETFIILKEYRKYKAKIKVTEERILELG